MKFFFFPKKERQRYIHTLHPIRYIRFQVSKKRGSRCFTSDSLLGGGYLRRPMSLTIVVVTLRALCQEWERGDTHELTGNKKNEGAAVLPVTPS